MKMVFWLLRTLLAMVLFFAVVGFLLLETVLLEDAPSLPPSAAPSPEDVQATRVFVRAVRAATAETGTSPYLSVSAEDLRGVMRLGARFLPGVRSDVTIVDGKVVGATAIPVPWIGGEKWLNVRAIVPAFDNGFQAESVTVGDTSLPPDLAVGLGRMALNLIMGDRGGDRILSSARQMQLRGDRMIFTMQLDEDSRGSVIQGVFGSLRGTDMPSPAEIDRYYVLIREAMERGELPQEGSFLPYLRFALQAALKGATQESLQNDYTAAIFGLTKACGARDFTLVVGRLAGDDLRTFGDWQTSCQAVTFNGRVDSRRHFVTAAAVEAASNRGFAISVGEFKELYDSISGAGGFDFTDIAANNSGIRMSDYLMDLPLQAWPDALARIAQESDLIVRFEGIPQIMPEAEFRARYRDVNSPEYFDELGRIEAKIDGLGLYRDR